jgi:uncharacterized phage protein (TIGR01671 family)
METIKFRGLSLDTGKWVYGYAIFDSKKENASIVCKQGNSENHHWAVIPETVVQYVGLTDKNGKEIYSGDEIRFPYNDEMEENGIGYCEAVVTFEKCAFRCREKGFNYEAKNQAPMTLDEFIEDEQIEIIGNIFENKYLIN